MAVEERISSPANEDKLPGASHNEIKQCPVEGGVTDAFLTDS